MNVNAGPILRLNADIWTSLAFFLEANDAFRLIIVGSQLLSQRVRRVTHLCIQWHSGNYVRFNSLSTQIHTFKSIRSLDFSTSIPILRHYTPINWDLLPKTLSSLKLAFCDSLQLLSNNIPLSSLCPNLEVLFLHDTISADTLDAPPRRLDLSSLPSSLRTLRLICEDRSFALFPDQLSHLPPELQYLQLMIPFFILTRAEFESKMDIGAYYFSDSCTSRSCLFPPLPNSITFLSLKFMSDVFYLDMNTLPPSLQSFEIQSDFVVNLMDKTRDNSANRNCLLYIDQDTRNHLPCLHTLLVETFQVDASIALSFVPPSVTKLALDLQGEGKDLAHQVLEAFGAKLVSFYAASFPDLNLLLLSGKAFLPQLKQLDMSFTTSPSPKDTLASLSSLQEICLGNGTSIPIPASATQLESRRIDPPVPYEYLRDLNLGKSLQILKLPRISLSTECLGLLPDSLEDIVARMEYSVLVDLWQQMLYSSTPLEEMDSKPDSCSSRFPRLSSMTIYASSPVYQGSTPETLIQLPLQLQTLELNVDFRNTDPAFLLLIKNSHLRKLSIRSGERRPSPSPDVLHHLPQTIVDLSLHGSMPLSLSWDVQLPPKLRRFCYSSPFDSELPTQVQFDDSPILFKLPPHLTALILRGLPKSPPISWYPTQLSKCFIQLQNEVLCTDYFDLPLSPCLLKTSPPNDSNN